MCGDQCQISISQFLPLSRSIDNAVSSEIDVLTVLASGPSEADTLRVEVKSKEHESAEVLFDDVDTLRVEVKSNEPESFEVLLEVTSGFFLIRFGMPPSGNCDPSDIRLPPLSFLIVLPLNCTGISLKAFLSLILTNFGRK